ncbi:conserved hypothetical protein [Neospora caninum Liverpool]|uniref:Metallo-beta-lactamase domain-containing protein n=1 Tax=Neospora caninum (strain Liverpool) TaxID=572307 RepID=F0VN29_NEOCL|nr:conserved hypothetical protein [Neospora caninum Liverpool]CBZ55125.1 conserved hypothetical protein [Neospora caninum Liverpool]CEL69851.1 TPA: hypothetical protein BN1204_055500 [Neospora caninum Liverpool]|eukprot:XP_003885153.1 conserved hypothetical protein [Neospora caninum Liverpool]
MPLPGPLPFTTIFVDFFRLPLHLRRLTEKQRTAKGTPVSVTAESSNTSPVSISSPVSSSSSAASSCDQRTSSHFPSSSLSLHPFGPSSCASSCPWAPSSLPSSPSPPAGQSALLPSNALSSHNKSEQRDQEVERRESEVDRRCAQKTENGESRGRGGRDRLDSRRSVGREGETRVPSGGTDKGGEGRGETAGERKEERCLPNGKEKPGPNAGFDGKGPLGQGVGAEEEKRTGGNAEFHFYSDNPWVFLLSHLHADHIGGLHGRWQDGSIFCSPTTRRLLLLRFPALASRVAALELYRVYRFFFHSERSKARTDPAQPANRDSSVHTPGGDRGESSAGCSREDRCDSASVPSVHPPDAKDPTTGDANENARGSLTKKARPQEDATEERRDGSYLVETAENGGREDVSKERDGTHTNDDSLCVQIMLVDAHHCQGAVLFVLQSPAFGVYVHTGDLNCNPDTVDRIIRDIKCAVLALRCADENTPSLCPSPTPFAAGGDETHFFHGGTGNDVELVCGKTVYTPATSRAPPSVMEPSTSSSLSSSSLPSSLSSSYVSSSVGSLSVEASHEERGQGLDGFDCSSFDAAHVDHLFLDNTYLHPVFDFSSSRDSFSRLVSCVRSLVCILSSRGTFHREQRARPSPAGSSPIPSVSPSSPASLWLLIGTDSLGKEDLLAALSQKLGVPISVSVARFEAMKVYLQPSVLSAHFRRGLPAELERALACQQGRASSASRRRQSGRSACEARLLHFQSRSGDTRQPAADSMRGASRPGKTESSGCCPCLPCLACSSCTASVETQGSNTGTGRDAIRETEGEGEREIGREEGEEEREEGREDEGETSAAGEAQPRQTEDERGTAAGRGKGAYRGQEDGKTEGFGLRVFGVSRHLLRRCVICLHNQWKSAVYRHRSSARTQRMETRNLRQADEEILSRTVVGVFCSEHGSVQLCASLPEPSLRLNVSRTELAFLMAEREEAPGDLALTVGDLLMEDDFVQEFSQELRQSVSVSRGEVALPTAYSPGAPYDGDEGVQLFMEACDVSSVFLAAGRTCISAASARQKKTSRNQVHAAKKRMTLRRDCREAEALACPRHGSLAAKQRELLERDRGSGAPPPRAFVHCIDAETSFSFFGANERRKRNGRAREGGREARNKGRAGVRRPASKMRQSSHAGERTAQEKVNCLRAPPPPGLFSSLTFPAGTNPGNVRSGFRDWPCHGATLFLPKLTRTKRLCTMTRMQVQRHSCTHVHKCRRHIYIYIYIYI